MAVSKLLLLTVVLALIVSTTAQFGGLGGFGFGFGGKPFGKPGFGGLGGFGGGKPSFGGLGFGKPGKPGLFGGLGGLGDLYRYYSPEDTGVPYYNWQNAPTNN